MIGHYDGNFRGPELMHDPAQFSDWLVLVKEILRRNATHRENHTRTNQFYLSSQIVGTRRDFPGARVSVAWRTTFQNIRNVDIAASQANGT
jgi:hypothetical protein